MAVHPNTGKDILHNWQFAFWGCLTHSFDFRSRVRSFLVLQFKEFKSFKDLDLPCVCNRLPESVFSHTLNSLVAIGL